MCIFGAGDSVIFEVSPCGLGELIVQGAVVEVGRLAALPVEVGEKLYGSRTDKICNYAMLVPSFLSIVAKITN